MSHKYDNLVLVVESKNIIQIISRNSGVSIFYMFFHAYFKDIKFYDIRRYVNLTKEVI